MHDRQEDRQKHGESYILVLSAHRCNCQTHMSDTSGAVSRHEAHYQRCSAHCCSACIPSRLSQPSKGLKRGYWHTNALLLARRLLKTMVDSHTCAEDEAQHRA